MRNPFIELHERRVGEDRSQFGSGWEGLLTEQLVFYLACDSKAADGLAEALLEDKAMSVTEVTLQPSTENGTPDLALEFEYGGRLFLEHKSNAEILSWRQSGSAGVALDISREWLPISRSSIPFDARQPAFQTQSSMCMLQEVLWSCAGLTSHLSARVR